jgi:hypothetical protein
MMTFAAICRARALQRTRRVFRPAGWSTRFSSRGQSLLQRIVPDRRHQDLFFAGALRAGMGLPFVAAAR